MPLKYDKNFRELFWDWRTELPKDVAEQYVPNHIMKVFYENLEQASDRTRFTPELVLEVLFNDDEDMLVHAEDLANLLRETYGGPISGEAATEDVVEQSDAPLLLERAEANFRGLEANLFGQLHHEMTPRDPEQLPTGQVQELQPQEWEFQPYNNQLESPEQTNLHIDFRDNTLHYSWDNLEGDYVYKVVTSESTEPNHPDYFPSVTVSEETQATDHLPENNSLLRWVSVWAAEIADRDERRAEVLHRIAVAPVIFPLQDVRIEHQRNVSISWEEFTLPDGFFAQTRIARFDGDSDQLDRRSWRNHIVGTVANSDTTFLDDDTQLGQTYTYVLTTEVFEGDAQGAPLGRSELQSFTIETVPHRLPVINDLTARQIHHPTGHTSVELTWTPPDVGNSRIYMSATEPPQGLETQTNWTLDNFSEHSNLTDENRVRIAVTIDNNRATMSNIAWPQDNDGDTLYFTVATVLGRRIQVGNTIPVVWVREVRDIKVVTHLPNRVITFGWPGKADFTELSILTQPENAADDVAPHEEFIQRISKREYDLNGGFILDREHTFRGGTYQIRGGSYNGGRQEMGPGVPFEVLPIWRYQYRCITHPNYPNFVMIKIKLTDADDRTPRDAPFLSMVYNTDRVPLHVDDGDRIPLYSPNEDGNDRGALTRELPEVNPREFHDFAWFRKPEVGFYRLMVGVAHEAMNPETHPLECYSIELYQAENGQNVSQGYWM